MRSVLDSLEFNVIKYEINTHDNCESKVYLSKRLALEVLKRHQNKRSIVRV